MKKRETSKTLAGAIIAGDILLSLATLGVTVLARAAGLFRRPAVPGDLIGVYNVATGVRAGEVFRQKPRGEHRGRDCI